MEFKNLFVTYEGKKSSLKDFQQFSILNEISLPKYFEKFLLKYENCEVKPNTFDNKYSINRFLGLKSKRNASIESVFDTYKKELKTTKWIPFAIDSGGWIFVLSLDEKLYGQIFIDRFDIGNENKFEFVAESMEVFIHGLENDSTIPINHIFSENAEIKWQDFTNILDNCQIASLSATGFSQLEKINLDLKNRPLVIQKSDDLITIKDKKDLQTIIKTYDPNIIL